MQAMYTACDRHKYALLVHVSEAYTSQRLIASILSTNIDGAVVLNEHLKDNNVELLREKDIPFVFLDKEIEENKISSILVNNAKGIMQGLEYLVHSGHKTIAFLKGTDNHDGEQRYQAFLQGMKLLRMPVYDELILQGFFDPNAAYSAVRGAYPHIVHRPDAIFCANDDMALGCIKALKDIGAEVPTDISVIGFDDGEAVKESYPELTTIRVSVQDMGNQAVEELFRLMKSGTQGKCMKSDTNLIIRSSCAIRFKGNL